MDIRAAEHAAGMTSGSLWIPGMGVSGTDERAAAKAVTDYDAELVLGHRGDTNEWIVFLRKGPHGGDPFPVLCLGTRLPSADEVTRKLYQTDVRRHGTKLYEQIHAQQERALAAHRSSVNERTGVAAEAMEHAFRQVGAHPNPRIFVPQGVKSVKPTEA